MAATGAARGHNPRDVYTSACGHCGVATWRGLDGEVCARLAVVDAAAFLTHAGERWVVLEDRQTWELERFPQTMLWLRDRWRRQQFRAGGLDYRGRAVLVLAQHVCRDLVPDGLRLEVPPRVQTTTKLQSEIPF